MMNRSPHRTRYTPAQLREMWSQFADIPLNDYQQTEVPFLHFPKGTDRMYIFRWFDEQYPEGVIGLMFPGFPPPVSI